MKYLLCSLLKKNLKKTVAKITFMCKLMGINLVWKSDLLCHSPHPDFLTEGFVLLRLGEIINICLVSLCAAQRLSQYLQFGCCSVA